MKILFTGGGTAGHIFPIIAIARRIRKIYKGKKEPRFFYIGPKDDFAQELLSREGIEVKEIWAGKIRRYLNPKSMFLNIFDIFVKAPIGFFQAFFYIFFLSPDLIFSKGGYGSLPAVFSGWLMLVPIFIHESDITPGLANRISSKLALEIFVSFPSEQTEYFPKKKMISVGNPIRTEILGGDKEKAKEIFQLNGEKSLILVLGGSQGSQRINDLILDILPQILKDFEIIHQTGKKNFSQVKAEAEVMVPKEMMRYYHPVRFLDEQKLKHALAAADLVISRAGSGTIFEIALSEKPSILIPLKESAQDHQLKNAYAYAESGACLVVEELNLTPHFFLERLEHLFSQPEKLKRMAKAAKLFSRPQAANIIAQYIIEYLSV